MTSNEFCTGEPAYHNGAGEGSGSCGIQCADWGAAAGEFLCHGFGCGDAVEYGGCGTCVCTGKGSGWAIIYEDNFWGNIEYVPKNFFI